MLRLSFIAQRRNGLRPLRKSRRERGLHLNAGLSVEQPRYEVARWRGTKMQRLGGLAVGCWWELGDRIRVRKKRYMLKKFEKKYKKYKKIAKAVHITVFHVILIQPLLLYVDNRLFHQEIIILFQYH